MYKRNDVTLFNEPKCKIEGLPKFSNKKVNTVCPLCGKERETKFCHISTQGHTFCRSCSRSFKTSQELIGQRFGRLLVLEIAEGIVGNDGSLYGAVKCKCSCGKVIIVRTSYLKNKNISSCGCRIRTPGPTHPSYKHDMSEEQRQKYRSHRKDNQSVLWKYAVKRRDRYVCRVCGSDKSVVAHHIESFSKNENSRFDVNNGITLCATCHNKYHNVFMGNNRVPATRKSFLEWLQCQ